MIWLSVTFITFTITSGIRVPASWTSRDLVQNGLPSSETFDVPFQNQHRTKTPIVQNYARSPDVSNSAHTMKTQSVIAVNQKNRHDDLKTTNAISSTSQKRKNLETLQEVPTKVNYPGVGKWAIRGLKHKPYLGDHKYAEIKSESNKPDGYEIFERAKPTFERQKLKLVEKFRLQKKPQLPDYKKGVNQKSDFVPTQLLSQVRRVDTEEHLPRDEDEPRLREVIKDTKVHVRYTEEGYEDVGYDHAGEERRAEENEGYAVRNSKPPKIPKPIPVPISILREFENYEDVTKSDSKTSQSKSRPRYWKKVHPLIHNESLMRSKRFENDLPNIKIEDYLEDYPIETTPSSKPKLQKYPYYLIGSLKHSPLKYAEDVSNIPEKIEGDLSFYDQSGAENCAGIPLDVNPVPDKVVQEKPANQSEPRLSKLGDKIVCLKSKYFGETPLDNPLFREAVIEEPRANFEEFLKSLARKKRNVNEDAVNKNELEESLPEQAALRVRIIRRNFRVTPPRVRYGLGAYRTTTTPLFSPHPTVMPKYKTISEVYYKDEIQPNEQLNVFSDIMNNIKKTRIDTVSAESEMVETKAPLEETPKSSIKLRIPQKKVKIRYTTTTPFRTSTTTTTEKPSPPPPRKNKYKNHKPDVDLYEEYFNVIKQREHTRSKPQKTELDEYIDVQTVGLSPPVSFAPVSFAPPSEDGDDEEDVILNTYPVSGMKPPGYHQPAPYYSFTNGPPLFRVRRKNQFRRIKRGANRLAYSEIRRQRPIQQPMESDDDYVPQRNRNFRYDAEKQRVIYDRPPVEDETSSYETEEVEIQTTPSTTTTTEMSGPSFYDYVMAIRKHDDYKLIMEPTEKTKVMEEVQTTTLPTLLNTPIPDFFNVVSKLKMSDGYVAIPEKIVKTTTAPPIVEVEEPEEDDDRLLRQSGGINLFDISEYLPKQETYAPTVIDYTKYKTIERKPVHNISSRYNMEKDSIPLSNTVRAVVSNRREDSEAKTHESTTVSTTVSTTKRLRLRTRRRPTSPVASSTTESTPSSTSQRNIRRRFRSTTTEPPATSSVSESQTQRPARRRFRNLDAAPEVPSNHKKVYTPIIVPDDVKLSTPSISPRSARLILPDVQIIKEYNHDKRHGGNYQREPKASTLKYDDPKSATDVAPKADAFYADENIPEDVNKLKESTKEEEKDIVNFHKEEVKIFEDNNGEKVERNSVFIVKDPSKRLYFYAPVK